MRSNSIGVRGACGLLAMLIAGLATMAPAGASTADDGAADGEARGIQVLAERLPTGDPAQPEMLNALWLWPAGRRGFQLAKTQVRANGVIPTVTDTLGRPPTFQDSFDLVAHDLDSGAAAGRLALDPPVLVGSLSGWGYRPFGAVDLGSGRLFVAYRSGRATTTDIGPNWAARNAAALSKGSEVCVPNDQGAHCIGGFHVVDGGTMQVIGRIPLRSISVDGAPISPLARAVTYTPSRAQGEADKLHLVVEDMVHNPAFNPQAPRVNGANIAYLVQIDIASGQQDWAVRLDGCRNSRETNDSESIGGATFLPNPAAVFRSMDATDSAVWVACHSGRGIGTVIRVPLDEDGNAATLPVQPMVPEAGPPDTAEGPDPAAATGAVSTAGGQEVFPGPEGAVEMLADAVSGRILMKVIGGDPRAEVWWIYDTRSREYIGTIGIGRFTERTYPTVAGLDAVHGRLYVFAPAYPGRTGGMYVADVRRTPLPQALIFPELAPLANWKLSQTDDAGNGAHRVAMQVDPGDDARLPRIYWRYGKHTEWRVLQDADPHTSDAADPDFLGRTLDLEERDGVTSSSWDGAARGYGVRVLLVGGFEGLARVGPADATAARGLVGSLADTTGGVWTTVRDQFVTPVVSNPCVRADRELILASVGAGHPAVIDMAGGRASANPVLVDSTLAADMEAPYSRCSPLDWDQVWTTALFGRSPADEPSVAREMLFGENEASCLSSAEDSSDETQQALPEAVGDPVLSPFAARVDCTEDDVSGWSQARGLRLADVSLSSAYASFRLYRDAGRGIVARVESVARGVQVPGVFTVDTVRTVAESWANGRKQPVAPTDRPADYSPNCDLERTAGTCFQRHLFGVRAGTYGCGPCGDEARLENVVNKMLGGNARIRLRNPDPRLAKGAENGFLAAVQKPNHERFADLVLNNDLLQTVVPGLEIIRYAAPGAQSAGSKARQIYQFAGAEVSSSYGIACLLVYDEAANVCGAPAEPPGSIAVSLTDADGKALAGGAFEVRQDIDLDGVVGLKDALLPNGACVTADDGVGTCTFDALQPGSYLVSQVAAPAGYGKVADPFVVELASGEARTVTFQNTSNVSTIAVSAADEAGKPVSGAQFAVYPDADSDGKVAADAQPAASCTTDTSGTCSMQVPAGSYVLVQTSAPGGLEPIAPVAFTFASGGQTAAVGVVNYPAGGVPAVEPAASPVEYSAPPQPVVTETVDDYQPTAEVADEPQVSIPDAVGGTIVRVIQAPGDALRLLSRDPKQAVAWTASLLLFALALMAVRRRGQAVSLIVE